MRCRYCDSPGRARQMCGAHYARWMRTLHPRPRGPVRPSTDERFQRYVDKRGGPDACWPFRGGRTYFGYGKFWAGGRTMPAHRYALIGTDPSDLAVLHSCDNPSCCNPAHLRLGTLMENIQDRNTKGRSATGSQMPHAKLSPDMAAAIRARYAVGGVSQQRLADELGVSQPLISQVIRGRHWRT